MAVAAKKTKRAMKVTAAVVPKVMTVALSREKSSGALKKLTRIQQTFDLLALRLNLRPLGPSRLQVRFRNYSMVRFVS